MRLEYDAEVDAAYIALRDVAHVHRTELLDEDRLVDYVGNEPVGIELLNVRLGVNVSDLPQADAVAQLLQDELGMQRSSLFSPLLKAAS